MEVAIATQSYPPNGGCQHDTRLSAAEVRSGSNPVIDRDVRRMITLAPKRTSICDLAMSRMCPQAGMRVVPHSASCWNAQSAHGGNTLIQIGSLPSQYLRCREALQTLAAGTQLGWRLLYEMACFRSHPCRSCVDRHGDTCPRRVAHQGRR